LYEFNTFIELNDWGNTVTITSTTFDRFSNCGSIIRNYKRFLKPEYFNESLSDYFNNEAMSGVFTRNQNEAINIDNKLNPVGVSPLDCTTSLTDTSLV
jgi:hypothetical protein